MWKWIILIYLLMINMSFSQLVRLEMWSSQALLDYDNIPLENNSVIHVMGSSDNIINTFQSPDDDCILGKIIVDSNALSSNGTFYSSEIFYNSSEFYYVYLRFFDINDIEMDNKAWGETNMECPYPMFGIAYIEFTNTSKISHNDDNFDELEWKYAVVLKSTNETASIKKDINNTIRIIFPTKILSTYRIWRSKDLINWTNQTDIIGTGFLKFFMLTPQECMEFFRIETM
jgi:hypothetical protein